MKLIPQVSTYFHFFPNLYQKLETQTRVEFSTNGKRYEHDSPFSTSPGFFLGYDLSTFLSIVLSSFQPCSVSDAVYLVAKGFRSFDNTSIYDVSPSSFYLVVHFIP